MKVTSQTPLSNLLINGKSTQIGGMFNFGNAMKSYEVFQDLDFAKSAAEHFHNINIHKEIDMLIALNPNYEYTLTFLLSLYMKFDRLLNRTKIGEVKPYDLLDN